MQQIKSLRTNDCIDEVIEKYSGMVYRLAFSHVKSPSEADDIFQEVFLRYIAKKRFFENEEHRKAWLLRVTINCTKKLRFSAWFRKTEPLPETITFEAKEDAGLYEVILTLPFKYRSVIHLFYYEDLPIKQIGNIMGAKESTIRSLLTRARAMLKEKLKGDFFDA